MSDDIPEAGNEYTPREQGLEGGHMWAERFADTAAELDSIAAGDVPAEVREPVEPALVAGWATWRSEETREADLEEFWGGFVHGVRAFLVEVRGVMTSN